VLILRLQAARETLTDTSESTRAAAHRDDRPRASRTGR
jgi:hypothetical protein